MAIREQLITVLQDKHLGVGAIPAVAETLAASARLNIWFLTFAKKQASDTQILELLDRLEEIEERCSAVVRRFTEGHNLAELMSGLDDITKQLDEAAKLP